MMNKKSNEKQMFFVAFAVFILLLVLGVPV